MCVGVRGRPLRFPEGKIPGASPLRDWMAARGMTVYRFATMIGAHENTVAGWYAGSRLPSLVYAFKIAQITGNAVPAESWLGTEAGRAEWAALGAKRGS